MADWFHDWVAERATPEGAEAFSALRLRAVAAVDRALALPPLVLIVAHGALFRSLRSSMGLSPGVRLMNAVPMLCEPPAADDQPWTLTAA
jgi:probable phosphoglycerate mutase